MARRRPGGLATAMGAALALALMATGASAQTYEQALDAAGKDIAAALNREGYATKVPVGVAPFLGGADAACEPLSSLLTTTLRRKLIDAALWMGSSVEVVETVDAKTVKAVVSGRWLADAGDTVRLSLKLGDVTDMRFRDIAVSEGSFALASLPPEARRCILTLAPVEAEVKADRPLLARASPNANGAVIGRVETGEAVWVSARVLSEGAEDWYVVRLPPDEAMPVGMRERNGFVYRPPLPPGLVPSVSSDAAPNTPMAAAPAVAPLSAAPEAPPLAVRIWTGRPVYEAGDGIRLFVEGSRDFYAVVAYVDAGGRCTILLPNRLHHDNRVAGDRRVELPGAVDRYTLSVGLPYGRETAYVFAATVPLDPPHGGEIGGGLARCPGTLAELRHALLHQTAGRGDAERAEDSVTLLTRPRREPARVEGPPQGVPPPFRPGFRPPPPRPPKAWPHR